MKAVQLFCALSVLSGVRSQLGPGKLYVQPDPTGPMFIACDFIEELVPGTNVCLHCISALLDWKL
jgi:hypothetical protein